MPAIHLTDSALEAIQRAADGEGIRTLRVVVTDGFEHRMQFDEPAPADVSMAFGSIAVVMDPVSASRADGMSIDYVTRAEGAGFVVTNPNEPKVRQMTAHELKLLIESARDFVLVDVRTEQERAIARIEGSRLLDETSYEELVGLDRNTPLVFQCHHGIRSQAAAEHFLREGFRNVYNLEGGIDAWSTMVDPRVARY